SSRAWTSSSSPRRDCYTPCSRLRLRSGVQSRKRLYERGTPMTATPSIRTTVVGSYPLPAWLAAQPSAVNLRDAVLVVLKTQELAGIDVVTDGELSRFDVSHPDTNGMIDYFVRPLEGVRSTLTRAELEEFRRQPGMGFRSQP